MNTTKPITKEIVKAYLFKEIADASLETDCPFTADDIEYFFENILPNLEDDDGIYSHYDATFNLSDKDFETMFWDHHNAFEGEGAYNVIETITCINHDTKLFHLNDLDDCKKLSENFPKHEALQAILLSNLEPKHKVEIFMTLAESYANSIFSDYDTLKGDIITFEYRYREYTTTEAFLENYDGVIAKSVLKRNFENKMPRKSKRKANKI